MLNEVDWGMKRTDCRNVADFGDFGGGDFRASNTGVGSEIIVTMDRGDLVADIEQALLI